MRIELGVHPTASTHEFADVDVVVDGAVLTRLDVEYSKILSCVGAVPPLGTDFLLIAAAVYAIDKTIRRGASRDAWTRDLDVVLPVSDPLTWSRAAVVLQECLSFLTGDRWQLVFVAEPRPLVRPSPKRRRRVGQCGQYDAVSLFSGGLDSLIGIIDWLETEDGRLLLVGHHDRHSPGPFRDQRDLLQPLKHKYKDRIQALLVQVGQNRPGPEPEITYRSRSLLFLALGMQAATLRGNGTPLIIPENGTIALNVPLTPSRRGSCSTRTAHPHYLALLMESLGRVGIENPLFNPLCAKTKGECVQDCRDPVLLRSLYRDAISCAKRGHPGSWVRPTADQCGRCMPCIYRRAALHSAGMDNEVYGNDVCTGEVVIDPPIGASPNESGSDLRACLSFLRAGHSEREIAQRLLANGSLDPARVTEGAGLVARAMNEIRSLLRAKAVPAICRRAGVV